MLVEAIGSFLFIFLFLVRLEQAWQGNAIAWLLAAQAAFTAFRIIFRKRAQRGSPWQIQFIAWLSAILPLGMIVSSDTGFLLAIPGLTLSIWSLDALGDSFSISPSDRGLVHRGPYRYLRHPMYAGELYSLIGQCLANLTIWNCLLLVLFGFSIYIRIVEEESLLAGYYHYARSVKWRLIPCLW